MAFFKGLSRGKRLWSVISGLGDISPQCIRSLSTHQAHLVLSSVRKIEIHPPIVWELLRRISRGYVSAL